jgi:hypothetical protein
MINTEYFATKQWLARIAQTENQRQDSPSIILQKKKRTHTITPVAPRHHTIAIRDDVWPP